MMTTTALVLAAAAITAAAAAAPVSTPPDAPIAARDMQRLLGKGFDVRWAEFDPDMATYSAQKPQMCRQRGFANARIRADAELTNQTFAAHLDRVIADTLAAGLVAILAKKGDALKENPQSAAALSDYTSWWGAAAQRYANVSHRLMFDLMVEPAKALGQDLDRLNYVYAQAVAAIRPSNPTRILSLAPGHIASPEYFGKLQIPAAAFPYAMGEWHDFAAGPSPDAGKKQWTGNGTAAQRKAFRQVADTAVQWQSASGGAPTWFGAWMTSDFNHGNHYSVPEQVAFAQFICDTMTQRGLPWSINTYSIFFGQGTAPVPSLEPVLNLLQACN